MKTGILFSGQGAQSVGMAKSLAENYASARALFERADAALGFSLSKICFEGPMEELTKTSVCQPALYVHGVAAYTVLGELGMLGEVVSALGLSLGEAMARAATRLNARGKEEYRGSVIYEEAFSEACGTLKSAISGHLKELNTGVPLEGVTVHCYGADDEAGTTTVTDADGWFVFDNLAYGTEYELVAASGLQEENLVVATPDTGELTGVVLSVKKLPTIHGWVLTEADSEKAVYLRLEKGSIVYGVVTLEDGDLPLPGVTVLAMCAATGATYTAVTNDDGVVLSVTVVTEPEVEKFTVTCDGVVIGEYEAGEIVDLPVPEGIADGTYFYRFFTWEGESVTRSSYNAGNGTSNGRTYKMEMPDHDVELTSNFIHVANTDGASGITAGDLATMKLVLVNGVNYSEEVLEATDVNGDGALNAHDVQAIKEYLVGAFIVNK